MAQQHLEFTLTIKANDGTKWLMPFTYLKIVEELNKDRICNLTVIRQIGEDIAEKTGVTLEFILSGGYREIEVHDQDGNLIYSGFIDETTGSAGIGAEGNITVSTRGFFALFEKRYTSASQVYSSTDAGAIAWDLINTTQSKDYGDFGITQGTITATKTRDRTYKWRNIKDAIHKLTSEEVKDGFDFDIDVNKIFNVFTRRGTDKPNIVFDAGFNIDNWQVRKTGLLGMANHVIVFGEGDGDDMVVEERDAADTYKDQYFLLEEGLSDKDNGDTTLLQDKGDKYLDKYKYPSKHVTLSCFYGAPDFNTYNVGDSVMVKITDDGVNELLRIRKRTVDMRGKVDLVLVSV